MSGLDAGLRYLPARFPENVQAVAKSFAAIRDRELFGTGIRGQTSPRM
jgi:hypothetical protein